MQIIQIINIIGLSLTISSYGNKTDLALNNFSCPTSPNLPMPTFHKSIKNHYVSHKQIIQINM